MNRKYGHMVSAIPLWLPLTLVSIGLLLYTILPKVFAPYFISDNQLAYLSGLNGDVLVSDGISDAAAQGGSLSAGNSRTILKTGKGNASLKMWDGSFVILDSNTTIEFNRQKLKDSEDFFILNLVSGRVLLINEHDCLTPTQVFVGGHITAQVFQAVVGLEVQPDDKANIRVDCLSGPCMVNGTFQLVSGQTASIEMSGAVQVSQEIPYDAWISLEKVGVFNPFLSNLFSKITPTYTPAVLAPSMPNPTAFLLPTIIFDTLTPLPSSTNTLLPSATPTSTPTLSITPYFTLVSSPTTQPTDVTRRSSTPVPTRTSTSTPTAPPSGTPLPTLTLTSAPSGTPNPTSTPVPTVSLTPAPTETPIPIDTPIPTDTPTPEPTITPIPTNTATSIKPSLTPTIRFTRTPRPNA